MRVVVAGITVALLLSAPGASGAFVRHETAPRPSAAPLTAPSALTDYVVASPFGLGDVRTCELLSQLRFGAVSNLPEAPPHTIAGVTDVPPPPSSLAMGLGALGCIGVVHLGRTIRKIAVGSLPDWYHADAPSQIGHVKRFELEMTVLEPVFACAVPVVSPIERPWLAAFTIPRTPCIPTRMPRSPPAACLGAC